MAAWLDRERAFNAAASIEEQRTVAASWPLAPADHPEVHPLQCALLLRAWTLLPSPSLPPLPAALPAASLLAWTRLALLLEPGAAVERVTASQIPWETVLSGLDLLSSPEPLATIRTLLAVPHEAPRSHALRALKDAVARGFCAIQEAHALLLSLLSSPETGLRTEALRSLAAPWAAGLPVPRNLLARRIDADDEDEMRAAVDAAAVRGELSLLPLLRQGPAARQKALLRWAGRVGDGSSLAPLLDLALEHPATLAEPVLSALVELHHRGHFLQEEQAVDLLRLLSKGVNIDSNRLAGLCFVARRGVLARIEGLDPSDPDWERLVPLLAAWLRSPRPPAGLFPLLLRVGSLARRPSVVIAALRVLRGLALDLASAPHRDLEALALARLDDYPEESLDLLEVVASPVSREELLRRSGWGTDGVCEAALRPRWPQVFRVLWSASSEEERAELLERARPAWFTGVLLGALTPEPTPKARELLRLGAGVDDVEAAFLRLTTVATPEDWSELLLGLRRVLEKSVAQPWQVAPVALGKRPREQEGDPRIGGEERWQLPAGCTEAVEAMEERWRRRYQRPACLLAPGKRLLPELLLALLPDAEPAALRAGVLRSLLRCAHPLLAARGAEALLHRDGDVAKLGARLLARDGAPWLSLELTRGVEDRDERRVRACLSALVTEEATWGIPAALRCLGHRNMNLKKAAAEALGKVATADCAPTLLRWLGQQDNPGFRAALIAATRRSLGDSYLAGVLAAIQGAGEDARRVSLLLAALDREIDVPLARRLARGGAPWVHALLAALQAGEIHLARGSLEQLAPELASAGFKGNKRPTSEDLPEPSPPDPFAEAVDDLFFEGFSPERASVVLALWPRSLSPALADKLRIFLGPWLDWMLEREDARPTPLIRAILERPSAAELERIHRATPSLLALFESCKPTRRAAMFPLVEVLSARLDPAERLDLGERLRRVLHDLPGLERSPLALLVRCGLLLRREDVERAFAGVRGVPNPAEVRRHLLADAFGMAGAPLLRSVLVNFPPEPSGQGSADWDEQLIEALRAHGPAALRDLRGRWPLPPEPTLKALIHELPAALPTEQVRAAALDWMEALRPIGVTAWAWSTPTSLARPRAAAPRPPELLDHEAHLARLGAWLRGEEATSWPPSGSDWSPSESDFTRILAEEIQPWLSRSQPARLLSLLRGGLLRAPLREQVFAALVERWEELSPAERAALEQAQGPEHHLPEQTWAPPGWQGEQRAALRRLFETRVEVRASSSEEASEDERARWEREARGEDEEAARRALSRLAEEPDEAWRELALGLVETGTPRVRHHVLRLIRKTLPREDTLRAARSFLRDKDASARRMAIRIVCHGRDREALPAVVELLLDPVAWVRKEALDGLRLQGEEAIPWVERARDRARPDQARRLQEALGRLVK
jgi:hypothetical protein